MRLIERTAILGLGLAFGALAHAAPAQDQTARTRTTETVSVERLSSPSLNGAGLLSSRATGFARAFWGSSSSEEVVAAIDAVDGRGVPEQRALFHRILLAETDAPASATSGAPVLVARLDKLIALGALDEAEALIARAGGLDPALFARRFTVALLTGRADGACDELLRFPRLSSAIEERIYCTARRGGWEDAALMLDLAGAIGGALDPLATDHLELFLDQEYLGEGITLAPPDPVTPLVYAIRAATGQPPGTRPLPLAYLHDDLQSRAALRDRIAAAERLVRDGDFPYPVLFAGYRARAAAASGGIWGRVEAVRRLDAAFADAGQGGLQLAVERADSALSEAGLRVALAREYAPALARLAPVEGGHAATAELLLLGGHPVSAADWAPAEPERDLALALSVALAAPLPETGDQSPRRSAVAAGFDGVPSPTLQSERLRALIDDDRQGEAILAALAFLDAGPDGPHTELTAALETLLTTGRQREARAIAVQTLLLERGA